MKKLMLSADSCVMLYEVSEDIINNFDKILEDFYKYKNTNIYDETLFVKYLKKKFGEDSVIYLKELGYIDKNDIPHEYKDVFWYNF